MKVKFWKAEKEGDSITGICVGFVKGEKQLSIVLAGSEGENIAVGIGVVLSRLVMQFGAKNLKGKRVVVKFVRVNKRTKVFRMFVEGQEIVDSFDFDIPEIDADAVDDELALFND